MRFDGGARKLLPDGSIEIQARRRPGMGAVLCAILALVAPGVFFALADNVKHWQWSPRAELALNLAGSAAWVLWFVWIFRAVRPRRPVRRVVFDASAKALRIVDRGRGERERSIPFADIHALTVEQREPRRIADALPVLTVNGEELLGVERLFANGDLEREVQALVGLPLHASPKDHDGIADF